MSNYPEWVLKYKHTGVYVVKKKDVYYLYRAHSQRIKGTDKIKRVFDGYIGRVTEEEGFIPVKDKISGDIVVYDVGLIIFLHALCKDIYVSYKKSHRSFADTIFVLAILNVLSINIEDLSHFGCLLLFKNFSIKQIHNDNVVFECNRCTAMIRSYLSSKVDPEDLPLIYRLLPFIHVIYVNNSYRLSYIDDSIQDLLTKYNVEVNKYVKNF